MDELLRNYALSIYFYKRNASWHDLFFSSVYALPHYTAIYPRPFCDGKIVWRTITGLTLLVRNSYCRETKSFLEKRFAQDIAILEELLECIPS